MGPAKLRGRTQPIGTVVALSTALANTGPTRSGRLERILPAALRFQEATDSFQEWLGAAERRLAQLWHADGCSNMQDAHRQSQVRAGGWGRGGAAPMDAVGCVLMPVAAEVTTSCHRSCARRLVHGWGSWTVLWEVGSRSWPWSQVSGDGH